MLPNEVDILIFLSTPSARRATFFAVLKWHRKLISIHALREEGDADTRLMTLRLTVFLSTPSARRATLSHCPGTKHQGISIHALREEGDPFSPSYWSKATISIHALREEGDVPSGICVPGVPVFLSTPSARRATLRFSFRWSMLAKFLSTPSARRATRRFSSTDFWILFLSTPSARRATRGFPRCL